MPKPVLERLTQQVTAVVSSWAMAPVVEAYQAMRGVAFLTAVTLVAEIGDNRRFETPRQLIAFVGWCPPNARRASRSDADVSLRLAIRELAGS